MRRLITGCVALGLVVGTVLVAAMSGTGAPTRVEHEVIEAVRAPFRAFVHKDARTLCRSFTSLAAKALARSSPSGKGCIRQVDSLMFEGQSLIVEPVEIWTTHLVITAVRIRGARASVVVSGSERSELRSLMLVRQGGHWYIATAPTLIMIRDCRSQNDKRKCPTSTSNNLLVFGFVENKSPLSIPPPVAVRRAGKREIGEFNAGATVAVNSGCLACHRIGNQGNERPGPSLNHVGSRLSEIEIEKAIVYPLEPMPSFKRLPKKKFHALVRFLQLLRSPA